MRSAPTGGGLAQKAKDRYEKVVRFLEAIGVSSETARRDAEDIEHHVSPETLDVFDQLANSNLKLPG